MSAEVETAAAIATLEKILGRMLDPVPFFDYIGAMEVKRVQGRIQHSKIDPDNIPWVPWSNYTASLRDAKGNYDQGIMWDTGDLLHSVYFDVDGAFGVDIGTDIWYAQRQQEGQGKIPARAIFGWKDQHLPGIENAFMRFLEEGVL
jgi:hypothetical protein